MLGFDAFSCRRAPHRAPRRTGLWLVVIDGVANVIVDAAGERVIQIFRVVRRAVAQVGSPEAASRSAAAGCADRVGAAAALLVGLTGEQFVRQLTRVAARGWIIRLFVFGEFSAHGMMPSV